jgi:hypothetical protein
MLSITPQQLAALRPWFSPESRHLISLLASPWVHCS